MKFTTRQPQFFPPLYLTHRATIVDAWVVLDDVQVDRSTLKMALPDKSLSLPASGGRVPYDQLERTGEKDLRKIRATLHHTYARHQAYRALSEDLDDLFAALARRRTIVRICWLAQEWLHAKLDMPWIVYERSKGLPTSYTATGRIVQAGLKLGASTYVTGEPAIRNYLDQYMLSREGIEVLAHDWQAPVDPDLSTLHYLLTAGPKETRRYLGLETQTKESTCL